MNSSVDTQMNRPRMHTPTSASVGDEVTPLGIVDQSAEPTYAEDSSRLSHLYSQCREACADPAGLRIFAASALVVGLMLSTAPVALAEVGRLLTTAPAAFAGDEPTREQAIRDEPDLRTGASQDNGNVQRRLTLRSLTGRLTLRSLTALIRWNGTSQALRCAYGLLFQGSARACEKDTILATSGYRTQLA
jgi:hypothetical protein